MIYTVTFNPSLDYIVSVENFRLGLTNRTSCELMLPGGKGINVSIVLRNLGLPNTALGFTAGFVGAEIQRRLEQIGVHTEFITVDQGVSRINVKLASIEGTEINGAGPAIGEQQMQLLMQKLDTLQKGDVLFLGGSIPAAMSSDLYRDIMKRLDGRGVQVVVDATGELLLKVLEYRPFLIKPNNQELGELFGVELADREAVVLYGRKLQEMGARNVLISMASAGAVLVAENGQIFAEAAPKGKLVNGVGAGDSMVAGFMAGFLERSDYKHAFHMGIAAGSASAFSEYLCTKEEAEAVYNQLISSGDHNF